MQRLRELLDRIPPAILTILGLVVSILAWAIPLPPDGSLILRILLLVVAAVLFVVGMLPYLLPATFNPFSWLHRQFKRIQSTLWLISGPVGVGVLLSGMEWLISRDLLNALGIGSAAYALVQLSFVWWEQKVRQLEAQRKALCVGLNKQIRQLKDEKHSLIKQVETQKILFDNLEKMRRKMEEERDGQAKLRCGELSRELEKWLEEVQEENPNEIMRQYDKWYGDRAEILVSDLKNLRWWDPPDDLKRRLGYPRKPDDLSKLADYLHTHCELDVFGERR